MKVTTRGDEVGLKLCGIGVEPWWSLSIQGSKGGNQEKHGGGTAAQGDRVHDRLVAPAASNYEAWAIIS